MTGFTRKRVAALALVGVALLTLAWVGMRGDDPVSVPKGALAGDLLLHPCTYDTEGGGYAADCGTLVVPENRHDSASRLIAIPVTRIRALSPHIGARGLVEGRRLIVWRARPARPEAALVAGGIEPLEVQREGGRRMTTEEYLRGLRK